MQPVRLFLLLATLGLAAGGQAQDEACTDCHDLQNTPHEAPAIAPGDPSRANGYPAGAARFEDSVHGDMDCIDCHMDVADASHEDGAEPVDCAACHDDAAAALAST